MGLTVLRSSSSYSCSAILQHRDMSSGVCVTGSSNQSPAIPGCAGSPHTMRHHVSTDNILQDTCALCEIQTTSTPSFRFVMLSLGFRAVRVLKPCTI